MNMLIMLALIFGVTSCGNMTSSSVLPPSTFASNFSAAEIVSANESHLIGIQSISTSEEADTATAFYQKNEEVVLQLSIENEAAFLEAVWFDIQDAILQSGAEIVGTGRGGEEEAKNFSFRYSDGEINGVVNMWGAQGQEIRYVLIVLIVESR